MEKISHYCQKCSSPNEPGEQSCHRCGSPLMLIVLPRSQKLEPPGVSPTYYEDHLLERVSLLELRISQLAQQLSNAFDYIRHEAHSFEVEKRRLEQVYASLRASFPQIGEIKNDELAGEPSRSRVISSPNLDQIIGAHEGSNSALLETLCSEAIRTFENHEEKQGFKNLSKAREVSPENLPLIVLSARYFLMCERFIDAEILLEKGRSIEPENADVTILLTALRADDRDRDLDDELLLIAKNDLRFSSAAYYLQGMRHAFDIKYEKALDSFNRSFESEITPEAEYLIGCVYAAMGNDAEAVEHFMKAVALDLRYADAWFMMSAAYRRMENILSANESLAAAKDSRESRAQCLKFLNENEQLTPLLPLPFLHFEEPKTRILFGGSARLRRFLFDRIVFT
ncbi:MAG: hypothetical protein KIS76_02485 [Pyrinomonadaceae bacterium]|nr:hypothetical protein [Pyrinomonadaceae bacterium]